MQISFRPKALEILKGYGREQFAKDVGAGVTVGIVALPLAMAFAIASGLKPETGLFTAIIAGSLISLLGGSRVQIGGPAGAFIVIVYGILQRYGLANLIIATAMSGLILIGMGIFRLGTLVRFIPVAVVIGFTNGIAVLVGLSQIKDFLGLRVEKMPADFFGILHAITDNLSTINPAAAALSLFALLLIVLWQFALPKLHARLPLTQKLSLVPGSVIALVACTAWVVFSGWDVETIGSRFGGIPSAMPAFIWPEFSWPTVQFLFAPAITLALLGAIESLLCARVADSMIDDRHDPNQELMAQGIANFITPFFSGMPATGTIARTVTNVKNGARTPVAGLVHALTLLLIVLLAAPLARYVPLAAMAAILMFVAWNMGEWLEFAHLRQFRVPYRFTLLAVFFLTVIVDLTVAVEVGLMAACMTFIYRISSLTRSEPIPVEDYPVLMGREATIQGYRLYGALFFGAVKLIENKLDKLPEQLLLLDLKNLLYIDTSGADILMDLQRACKKRDVRLLVCGLKYQPGDILQRCGFTKLVGEDATYPDLKAAMQVVIEHAKKH